MPVSSASAPGYPRLDPAVAERLTSWFVAHARPLPWRRPGTSAWGVLVSEVMSQQTPVSRVAPIWLEWMERWPRPETFARATKAEVLRAWSNLGYPRRALRLHECAAEITRRFGGRVPDDVAELESLPGIGAYTARAVACFHFGQNVPVVDTNVRRVYRRLIEGEYLAGAPRASDLRKVEALIGGTTSTQGPVVSVALMELGALICTATAPRCGTCPVVEGCAWREAGCPQPSEKDQAGAKKRVQKFAGTDRQVRGKIMAVLRAAKGPVSPAEIDVVWPDAAQRSRCLGSLISDGLAHRDAAGMVRLPD